MNDTELDELLDIWKTPPPPAGLRTRLQDAAARESESPRLPGWKFFGRWKVLLASAAGVVLVFLLVNPAISQKISPPPYTVDSEIIVHPDDARGCFDFGKIGLERILGCWPYARPMHMLMSSYNAAGSEVVLSWSDPGKPLEAWLWSAKLAMFSALDKMHGVLSPSNGEEDDHAVFHFSSDEKWTIGEKDALPNSGCRPVSRIGEVIGNESVLGYPTIIGRIDYYKTRLTLWMAPQLSCFALRARVERQQPDGSWTLMNEKKALKVTVRQ
jgi:hypothetical protein